MLYIVPTPIGNLKDITLRSLEIVQNCDGIICEDSRRTGILLNHFQIKKPLSILNDYNETKQFPEIILKLQSGQNLVLISDAGTPLISDPGYKLVRECLALGLEVDSLPGPSSVITALTLSGLPPDKFLFLGYFPEKQGKRVSMFNNLIAINNIISTTFIAFVAPHKLIRTLEDMKSTFGDVEIVLASELTKIHQSVKNQSVSGWLEDFKKIAPKGEFTLLLNLQKK